MWLPFTYFIFANLIERRDDIDARDLADLGDLFVVGEDSDSDPNVVQDL